eukprot:scaffold205622_cov31-Tisochrysis_lutea.AAC.1
MMSAFGNRVSLSLAAIPHLCLAGARHLVDTHLLLLLHDALCALWTPHVVVVSVVGVRLGPMHRHLGVGHHHRSSPSSKIVQISSASEHTNWPRLRTRGCGPNVV